jgi:hypothetical protein
MPVHRGQTGSGQTTVETTRLTEKNKKQLFPLGPIYLRWPAVNSQSFNH